MDTLSPVVLEGISLSALMRYVLKKHAPLSTLIVCCAKDAFLQQLHDAIAQETDPASQDRNALPRQPWTAPTLRLLASSRNIKVAFCPDLLHLRAYLAAYAQRKSARQDDSISEPASPRSIRTLAILNPIELHRPTSAYSAQGLNRTFAAAVDAAHHTNSRLVMAECPISSHNKTGGDVSMELEPEDGTAAPSPANAWNEEVSILNVTTKTFGAGERGWVGRTVKVRAVTERWCVFQDMSAVQD